MPSKYLKSTLVCLFILLPFFGYADTDPRTNYRSFIEVVPVPSAIPSVIEVPLPPDADNVLVYEPSTNTYIDSKVSYQAIYENVTYSIFKNESTDGISGFEADILDKNYETSIDLLVKQANAVSKSDFYINASQPVTISSLEISYGLNSVLPREVSLFLITPFGGEELVALRNGFEVRNINFPEHTGLAWRLAFVYDQPIRINDIEFGPTKYTRTIDKVSFLAQPNLSYFVYLYPEQLLYVPLRNSGNLNQVTAVSPAYTGSVMTNPQYQRLDQDQDNIPDEMDNCPQDYNPDQISTRNNLKGDVCDDFDNDGIINTLDNCEFLPNPNQSDEDGDLIGDVCDESESRLTEMYPWLPWLGMGITLLVMLILFITVARHPVPVKEVKPEQE